MRVRVRVDFFFRKETVFAKRRRRRRLVSVLSSTSRKKRGIILTTTTTPEKKKREQKKKRRSEERERERERDGFLNQNFLSSSFLSSKSGANLTTNDENFLFKRFSASPPLRFCPGCCCKRDREEDKRRRETRKRARAPNPFLFFLKLLLLKMATVCALESKGLIFSCAGTMHTTTKRCLVDPARESEREREKTITRITINICSPHDNDGIRFNKVVCVYKSACCCVRQRVRRQHSRERERERETNKRRSLCLERAKYLSLILKKLVSLH